MKKINLLILKNTQFLSKEDINVRKYALFSTAIEGAIIQRVLDRNLVSFEIDRLKFCGVYLPEIVNRIKPLAHLFFFIGSLIKIRRLSKEKKFDFILASDPFSSGLMAYVFKLLFGPKLLVEINGSHCERKAWYVSSNDLVGRVKYQFCQYVIPFIVNQSFAVKLLYPQQLDALGSKIRNQNIHVFHEYVPVSDFSLSVENERYILLLGAPWHVKGVDLLLRAFDSLPDGYHGRLRIVGWMSEADISGLKKLIPNNKHVTFEKPVFYEEALRLIGKCDFLVLPSRTEAMGRVLMEARAHGKAVIGSTADGIPNYITHNQTGLLFDSGCWESLRDQMHRLISEPRLKKFLEHKGREVVMREYDEATYLRNYLRIFMQD